jgi:hypothetical protein
MLDSLVFIFTSIFYLTTCNSERQEQHISHYCVVYLHVSLTLINEISLQFPFFCVVATRSVHVLSLKNIIFRL